MSLKLIREYLQKFYTSIICKALNRVHKESTLRNRYISSIQAGICMISGSISLILQHSEMSHNLTVYFSGIGINMNNISTIIESIILCIGLIIAFIGILTILLASLILFLKTVKIPESNQDPSINHKNNLIYFIKVIFLLALPDECQEHFQDETKKIFNNNKKYIAYYKIIKLYFWDFLLLRIMKDCYQRIKTVLFRSYIK